MPASEFTVAFSGTAVGADAAADETGGEGAPDEDEGEDSAPTDEEA